MTMTCWAQRVEAELEGSEAEIADMYLHGPEAREYRDDDVQRAMSALGFDVDLADIKAHRGGRCACRQPEDA